MVEVTALPATLTAPHAAPPVGEPQLAATLPSFAGTVSLNEAPLAASGPALLTTIV